MSEIEHAVFVYRDWETAEIRCVYADAAVVMQHDKNFEHLATLNPRIWIERNWDKVETKP
jgi:hypothetical protein